MGLRLGRSRGDARGAGIDLGVRRMTADREALFADARREAFDRGDCTNGPDEYGNYPCEPHVLFGANEAECQTCGRVAAWGEAAKSDG